ncbi:hypothetical protein ABK040_010373 [Willaertia magna]
MTDNNKKHSLRYEFTKIPFNECIGAIYENYCCSVTLIRTSSNEIYFSGKNTFGMPNNVCKYFKTCFKPHYYVDEFTKIDLIKNNNEMKYCYPILMADEIFCVNLDYKISCGSEISRDEAIIGLKCLKKTKSTQLTD